MSVSSLGGRFVVPSSNAASAAPTTSLAVGDGMGQCDTRQERG